MDKLTIENVKISITQQSAGTQRYSFEDVKTIIESRKGHEFLSTEYKNNTTKLQIKCPEGYEFDMSFHNFQHGHGCPNGEELKPKLKIKLD